MKLGRVVGTVVCTRKEPAFEGKTLLMVQPLSMDRKPLGQPLVAVDTIGCGVGETILYVRGREGSFPMLPEIVPTDAGITCIVDYFHLED
jgi:ethanolamine utilization protein EutN